MRRCLAVALATLLATACGGLVCPGVNDPGTCCNGERLCNAGAAFECVDGVWQQRSGCWAGTCIDGQCILPDGGIEPGS